MAFLDYINEDYVFAEKEKANKQSLVPQKTGSLSSKHRTPRDPNLKIRFQVLNRDSFKCCMCGRSPANTPGLELHIDHIIPWAKGGETTIENLQTLCSDCNLGKSDMEF